MCPSGHIKPEVPEVTKKEKNRNQIKRKVLVRLAWYVRFVLVKFTFYKLFRVNCL